MIAWWIGDATGGFGKEAGEALKIVAQTWADIVHHFLANPSSLGFVAIGYVLGFASFYLMQRFVFKKS